MIFLIYTDLDRFFFRFVTMHAFDRRTDSFLVSRPRCMHWKKWKGTWTL